MGTDYKKPSGALFKLAKYIQDRTENKDFPITEAELYILAKKNPVNFHKAREIVLKRLGETTDDIE